MRAFLIFVLGLALPSVGAAQSIDVTGTWNVTWDSGLRTNGAEVIEVTRRITAELRLVQRGDSVSGTWVMPVPIGGSAERVVTGMVRGAELQLESEVRPMDVNGRQVPMRFAWTGVIAEGDMRGTMFMQIEGRDAPPRRWEAKRQRNAADAAVQGTRRDSVWRSPFLRTHPRRPLAGRSARRPRPI